MFIVPLSFNTPDLTLDRAGESQSAAGGETSAFKNVFNQVLKNMEETQAQSQKDSYDLAMGNIDNLYTMMINSEKATAALELTVQLTNRAVNAYKEISQIQI